MKSILERVKNEPALLIGLVSAAISLILAFGIDLTDKQVGGIMAVVVALLALVTRSQVTPTRAVAAEVVKGEVVTGAATPPAGEPAEVVPADPHLSFLDRQDGVGARHVEEQGAARHPEEGAVDTSILLALACVVVILCGLVWLFQAL